MTSSLIISDKSKNLFKIVKPYIKINSNSSIEGESGPEGIFGIVSSEKSHIMGSIKFSFTNPVSAIGFSSYKNIEMSNSYNIFEAGLIYFLYTVYIILERKNI